MSSGARFNPFPGLRPFEPDEDHLFFGREREIDDLLRRLRTCRFLSVVGTSGSGKSSLVHSGLIPSLHSGFMVSAGSNWRVATFRPGEDPIGHLASALNAPDALGTTGEMASTNRVLLEATLRRSSLGLISAVRQAGIPPQDNLLVVVDQFEELFRFQRSRPLQNSKDEAAAFVKLLLEAVTAGRSSDFRRRDDAIGLHRRLHGILRTAGSGQLRPVPGTSNDPRRTSLRDHWPCRCRRRSDLTSPYASFAQRSWHRPRSAAGTPTCFDANLGSLAKPRSRQSANRY